MIGHDTTVLSMIGEALASPEKERQSEGLMMCAVLFEKFHGAPVELVEPFSSVDLDDDFINVLFSIVRAKALDERVLPSTLGVALWTLGKCPELRALAAVSAALRDQLLTPDICRQAAGAIENHLTALGPDPTAIRLYQAAKPKLEQYRADEKLRAVLDRLEEKISAA